MSAYTVERRRPIEQPKSFLFLIARHLALSQLIRKGQQVTDSIEDFEDSIVIELVHSVRQRPRRSGLASVATEWESNEI